MNRIQRIFSPFLVVMLAVMVSACGFQLRGTVNVASDLKHLSIEGGERDFQRLLMHRLEQAGIAITDSAPYKVEILSLTDDEMLASTSGGNIVTDYELTVTLNWQLESESGEVLLPAQKLTQQGVYQRFINEYNASQNAREQTMEELQQNLAMALTRRIAALTDAELQALADQARERAAQTEAQ
ncbi:LPS assembly lipoprotein LptE [Parendozoicomonas haliclonae]|uniref:LPS-assembly lipoprotein LptE n=1 Tax=Parendozoicomonas haliclonae TaxID=1960125 RepID=A0A1X7AGJ8_9GAMM|nr:LPS assembly lipoprotein LptE [Parendozoicomonas haliclonae]SMA40191.1 LPS-assembly lipoprotein RlpB [Parendozoicomonas haliclonae]